MWLHVLIFPFVVWQCAESVPISIAAGAAQMAAAARTIAPQVVKTPGSAATTVSAATAGAARSGTNFQGAGATAASAASASSTPRTPVSSPAPKPPMPKPPVSGGSGSGGTGPPGRGSGGGGGGGGGRSGGSSSQNPSPAGRPTWVERVQNSRTNEGGQQGRGRTLGGDSRTSSGTVRK